jgi:hypothetical protein
MFNEERAFFIMDLCFPDAVRPPELQADLELAQALAEDWPEWSDVARAWMHHFGKERIADAVACARRAEESAFLGKHIDELEVEQFEPNDTNEAFMVTQGVACTWHAIACVDHEYLGRAVKTMEICERCSLSSVDTCWCARQWLTLPIEDSLPRALDAMNHAEALYFADLVAPAETDARVERWRLDRLKESHEWICKEWLRSFGTGLGGRRLRHFQKRAGPGSEIAD